MQVRRREEGLKFPMVSNLVNVHWRKVGGGVVKTTFVGDSWIFKNIVLNATMLLVN